MKRIILILLSIVTIASCTAPNSRWEGNMGGEYMIIDFDPKGYVDVYTRDLDWAGGGLCQRKGDVIEFAGVSVRIKSGYGYDYYKLQSATIDKRRMRVESECDGYTYYDTFIKM